jgi:hypothetical protein
MTACNEAICRYVQAATQHNKRLEQRVMIPLHQFSTFVMDGKGFVCEVRYEDYLYLCQ